MYRVSRKRGRLEEIRSDGLELLSLGAFKKRLDVALGELIIADKVVIGQVGVDDLGGLLPPK